jgi:hypothetical protein
MRRALLAVGSDTGHANKCSASRIRRRSRQHGAEASALGGPMKDRLWIWLTPVVIHRTQRGTHDRADVTEPCRGRATAVSCRAASRTSRRACPCPVLLCTLHIGGANLKSRATCDSPVPPRSPTDVPSPCGQLTCRICPDNSYNLQAEAIRGLQPRSDRSEYHGSARTGHRRRRFRRMPAAASGTRASRMHFIMNMPLAGSPAVASRPAEAARC